MSTEWVAWDCVVFFLFVCATSFAPLWARRSDRKNADNAKQAYIFAGGGVSTLAMILSVARGTLGVRSFLGFPSELVYEGSAMWETLYGMVLAFPLVCWIFVPVYYRLRTNSVYEYLEMRFGTSSVRKIAAATFLIRQVLNLGVTVFTPTVALHAVLSLPHWASAAALTTVAIVFNLLGGLAAAIRADVIQTLVMILVSALFILQATVKAGGPENVLTANINGGRLKFFNFAWDPTVRVDTLSAIFGQLFMSMSIYGCQQTFVQRYCSMSSEKRVRRTLLANIPAVSLLFSLSWFVGMALYALYQNCDPLKSRQIDSRDEILPFYVKDQFGFLPGMVGLFLGSLFNGALSFLVSNVNSLATVTWEDFVSLAPAFKGINDKQQLTVIKIIGIVYAFAIMGLSLFFLHVDGVVEGSLLVTSATSGSLLGVFALATLCPIANGRGAVWGMIASHLTTGCLVFGRLMFADGRGVTLPLSIQDCPNITSSIYHPVEVNQTFIHSFRDANNFANDRTSDIMSAIYWLSSISYMWYSVIGTTVCVIIGITIGWLTSSEDDAFDSKLLHPCIAKMYDRMPGNKQNYLEDIKYPEKDCSEKTVVTVSEKIEEKPLKITSTDSRLFDAYEKKNNSPYVFRTKF